MQNVLVIFQTTQQPTEGLALAFGLGAVQAGANIRLRHLDPSPATELAHVSYGILRPEDLHWAEGIGIILESAYPKGLEELSSVLKGSAASSEAAHKWAYVFHADPSAESLRFIKDIVRAAHLQQFEDDNKRAATPEYMTHIGQQLASVLQQNA